MVFRAAKFNWGGIATLNKLEFLLYEKNPFDDDDNPSHSDYKKKTKGSVSRKIIISDCYSADWEFKISKKEIFDYFYAHLAKCTKKSLYEMLMVKFSIETQLYNSITHLFIWDCVLFLMYFIPLTTSFLNSA